MADIAYLKAQLKKLEQEKDELRLRFDLEKGMGADTPMYSQDQGEVEKPKRRKRSKVPLNVKLSATLFIIVLIYAVIILFLPEFEDRRPTNEIKDTTPPAVIDPKLNFEKNYNDLSRDAKPRAQEVNPESKIHRIKHSSKDDKVEGQDDPRCVVPPCKIGITRFTFQKEETFVLIKSHLDKPNGLPRIQPYPYGVQGRVWTIQNNEWRLDVKLKASPHPDVIGMICFSAFFSFLADTIEFPFPVSTTFAEIINNPTNFRQHGSPGVNHFHVLNVDPYLRPYVSNGPVDRSVISFGGGHDSMMIVAMMPNATLVYENQVKTFDPTDEVRALVNGDTHDMLVKRGYDYRVVNTNSRSLGSRHGLLQWTQIFSAAVLYAADERRYGVLLGSTVDGTFLQDGRKYTPRHKIGNAFMQAYEAIGIRIITPVHGLTQMITSWVVLKAGLARHAVYCEQAYGGKPCHQCAKCQRKELFMRAACEREGLNIAQETDIPVSIPWEERYQNNFKGDTRKHLLGASAERLLRPQFTLNRIGAPRELLESVMCPYENISWTYGWYPRAFDVAMGSDKFIEYWKTQLDAWNIRNMTDEEIEIVEHWEINMDAA